LSGGGQIDDLPQAEILYELAYDLEFFEPNSQYRKESPSFFGYERALEEIHAAILKLRRFDGGSA
jgi:hypothetical protein